jgi:hypothetical protein
MNRCARNCHINCQISRENCGNGGYRGGAIFCRGDINSRRPCATIAIVNNETPVYYQSKTLLPIIAGPREIIVDRLPTMPPRCRR